MNTLNTSYQEERHKRQFYTTLRDSLQYTNTLSNDRESVGLYIPSRPSLLRGIPDSYVEPHIRIAGDELSVAYRGDYSDGDEMFGLHSARLHREIRETGADL